jgi:hypothetical protein
VSEYKKKLQEQYQWYINTIELHYNSNRFNPLPTDSFYFGIHQGNIKQNIDDDKWLENSIDKLQATLAKIELSIDREKFKKRIFIDLAEQLKRT